MAHLRSLLLLLPLALLPGCPDSHGTEHDAGPSDAGRDVFIGGDCCIPRDVGLEEDAPDDAPRPVDCSPDDAHAVVCPAGICDGPDHYAWDGERCVTIPCGTCEGEDCASLPTSLDACRAAHATCDAALCTATGGDWQFWAEECGHHVCGVPPPVLCAVGMPVCDCGYERSFEPGVGCVPDECPVYDPVDPQTLCGSTGGTWTTGICCPTTCGVHCDLECAAPACVCGPFEVFDAIRGCVLATECFVRGDGETCTNIHSRCEDGLICCQDCGGAGCAPERYCRAPLCDADPNIDECGNNLLAP